MKKLPQKRWMSLWRHFYDRERTAEQLSNSMIEWQEKWSWDFMKVNPAACYHVLDWGAKYKFFSDGVTEPELVRAVVEKPEDVEHIGDLDVTSGFLGDQLYVLRKLRTHFGPVLPIVETVFSPVEIAHRLMQGREAFQKLRKEAPEAAHALLGRITEVFREFCLACLSSGADGIFFATKWASSEFMTWPEYEEFGKKYELRILNALKQKDALVILHVCGAQTYLNEMLDYPADIFSYDFYAEGSPKPEEVIEKTGKFVLGGIDPVRLDPQEPAYLSERKEWLVGPSCVLPVTVSDEAVASLRHAFKNP